MKTLIIGLGNPLVTDDSVGLRVAAELKGLLAERPDVEVTEDYWGGLRLMERMVGYDRAIVVDAISTGAPPGTISAHDVNLPTALAFGRRAGVELPDDEQILLVGIEVEDIVNFGENCTPSVQAAVPRAVEDVLRALDSWPSEQLT